MQHNFITYYAKLNMSPSVLLFFAAPYIWKPPDEASKTSVTHSIND